MRDPKFPYTYACQMIQKIAGPNGRGKPRISMAEAAEIRNTVARVINVPDARLALRLAAEYLRTREDEP